MIAEVTVATFEEALAAHGSHLLDLHEGVRAALALQQVDCHEDAVSENRTRE